MTKISGGGCPRAEGGQTVGKHEVPADRRVPDARPSCRQANQFVDEPGAGAGRHRQQRTGGVAPLRKATSRTSVSICTKLPLRTPTSSQNLT
jgi:hypothetical protein